MGVLNCPQCGVLTVPGEEGGVFLRGKKRETKKTRREMERVVWTEKY